MKKLLKRLFTVVIVILMFFGVKSNVFADGPGKITITNATEGQTYTLYKVFAATVTEDRTSGGDGITYTSTWTIPNNDYFEVKNGNVVAKDAAKGSDGKLSSGAIDFLKNNISNFSKKNEIKATSSTVEFTNLEAGYYFINTTTGTAVTVNSITPNVNVVDKNEGNTIDKKQKGGDTSEYTDGGITADIGDVIDYKLIVSIRPNSENVVVYDVLSTSLTLIKNDSITGPTVDIDSSYYTVGRFDSAVGDVTYNYGDNKTKTVNGNIVIRFNDSWLNQLTQQTNVEITYQAVINENAETATNIPNTVNLVYGHNYDMTGDDQVNLKTYKIDLTKIDKDVNTKMLVGAKFNLYDARTSGNQIPVVLVSGTGGSDSTVDNVYRHAKDGETGVEMITGKTGIIIVKGLQNGSYFFEETAAPSGYNKLDSRTEATTITNANGTIVVTNAKGSTLPSTGGIGTTIFHVGGASLAIIAAILLIAKKRMNNN